MVKMGHELKYSLNLSASSVALVTMILRSSRFLMVFFSNAKRTSVAIVRSWASSSIMTEYLLRSGSMRISRCNLGWVSNGAYSAGRNHTYIPSVMYLILVAGLVTSSNLIV